MTNFDKSDIIEDEYLKELILEYFKIELFKVA